MKTFKERDMPQPKNKHEEIMLCIESTNEIVSDMSNHLQNVHDIVSKLLKNAEEAKKRRIIAIDIIDKFVKFIEGKMKE